MRGTLHRVGWVGLTVVGAFLLFAIGADLAADARTGLPADHQGAFAAIAGRPFAAVRGTDPGVASYITSLEAGMPCTNSPSPSSSWRSC